MATGDRMMNGRPAGGTAATSFPPEYRSGPRAKDWVKCVDPECERNKSHQRANAWRRRNGYEEQTQEPHCHPVF